MKRISVWAQCKKCKCFLDVEFTFQDGKQIEVEADRCLLHNGILTHKPMEYEGILWLGGTACEGEIRLIEGAGWIRRRIGAFENKAGGEGEEVYIF